MRLTRLPPAEQRDRVEGGIEIASIQTALARADARSMGILHIDEGHTSRRFLYALAWRFIPVIASAPISRAWAGRALVLATDVSAS
jgi:hypothetical protein